MGVGRCRMGGWIERVRAEDLMGVLNMNVEVKVDGLVVGVLYLSFCCAGVRRM